MSTFSILHKWITWNSPNGTRSRVFLPARGRLKLLCGWRCISRSTCLCRRRRRRHHFDHAAVISPPSLWCRAALHQEFFQTLRWTPVATSKRQPREIHSTYFDSTSHFSSELLGIIPTTLDFRSLSSFKSERNLHMRRNVYFAESACAVDGDDYPVSAVFQHPHYFSFGERDIVSSRFRLGT